MNTSRSKVLPTKRDRRMKPPSVKPLVPKRIRAVKENRVINGAAVQNVLRHIDPINKQMIERKLFVDQYVEGISGRELLKSFDNIDPLLKRELEPLYDSSLKVSYTEGLRPRTQSFLPSEIEVIFNRFKHKEIRKSYKNWLNRSAVVLLLHDSSNSLTNKRFNNSIVRRIKTLENSESLMMKNMDPLILGEILHNDSNLLDRLKQLSSNDHGGVIKSICIPPHAISLTQLILPIVDNERQSFPLVGVYFNLKTSSSLKIELKEALQRTKSTEEINYQSLLKIAAEQRSTKTSTTKELVTTIGQLGLLTVGISPDGISFTKSH